MIRLAMKQEMCSRFVDGSIRQKGDLKLDIKETVKNWHGKEVKNLSISYGYVSRVEQLG